MVTDLSALIGRENVLAGAAVRRTYDCDAYTVDRSPPSAVAFPTNTEAVQKIVVWCCENSVPFTPRGAGTGLSGGATPMLGGVIVSTKRMTQILEIDIENRCLKAQAGAVNSHLTKAVAEYGLHFAPDPSSQSVCTLGGNISENSGGPHTLKYGVTANHVLQVTLIDSVGNAHVIGSRVPGHPGPDPLSLVVGSEGTLGIVTEAWVKLTPTPALIQTVLAAFPTIRAATETVTEIIASGVIPAALEMMDRNVLVAVKAAFGLDCPEESDALLLIECDGEPDRATTEIEQAIAVCQKFGALSIKWANDPIERAKLWTARKKGIGAMGRLAPTIVTHDGVIPRSKLPDVLDFVYEVSRELGVGVANIFHAGDGNLHPCFYFDDRVPGLVDKVIEAGERILNHCLDLGGSVTGEHGVGIEKASIWASRLSANDLAAQETVKQVFSVTPLCNPCKVLPDQKGCVEHVRRWRGAAT